MSVVEQNGTPIENLKWCRLANCIVVHVKKALVGIVHNTINHKDITPLPSDPSDLYNFMVKSKSKLARLREDERHLLTPTDKKVFSDKLDVSMLRFLIRTFSGVKNKDGNWNEPRDEDHSIAAAVYRAAKIRNEVLHHGDPESIDEEEFEDKWRKIKEILDDLQYKGDISDLKTGAVDTSSVKKLHSNMSKDFENILLNYKESCKKKNMDELKMFVERKFKDESTNNIITHLDQLLSNHDSVMVSGEAGLGKTYSAKHLKYLWSSGKIWKEKMLLYIDSKKVNKDMYKPSHAAPICVSELRSVFKSQTEGYLESFGCVKKAIENLVIVIDGVDELHIEEKKLNRRFLNALLEKINQNEEISAMETIMGIYFGIFFPRSKIIIFGRRNEIDRLKGIQDWSEQSTLFKKQTRAILELQPLDEDGIKELIARTNCYKTCCSCEKCTNSYSLVKDVEFRNIPSHLMALIGISNEIPRSKIGPITKTKIFIVTIFNLLKSHTSIDNLNMVKTFKKLLAFDGAQEFRECIQNITKICFFSLLARNVTIEVEEYNEDGVKYLKYEQTYEGRFICKKIKRAILEQLDFFYVRDLEYDVILEPYHLTNMEFLASCYIYGRQKKWDLLLKLNADRQYVILPYVAGLHSNEGFTKDFVSGLLLQDTSHHDIEHYLNWLFSIEDVRNDLPNRSEWHGLKENDQLFPSFDLLHRINEEVDVFDNISKRLREVQTLLCVCYEDFKWYSMMNFYHKFLTSNKEEYNIESFMSDFKKYRIVIQGFGAITNMEQFNLLSEMFQNKRLIFYIHNLYFNLVMPHSTQITKHLKFLRLCIVNGCDSHTIDLLLDASSLPTTTTSSDIFPVFICKVFDIDDVTQLNDQQSEKLFEVGLSGILDYITLRSNFTSQQIEILKKVESRYTNKLINIELSYMTFNHMLDLPNLGTRRVSLYRTIGNVTDSDVIRYQKYITPKYTKNYSNYKIISSSIPFIRKENNSQSYEQSMYFHFRNVNFEEVSPEVFVNTFSLIPSLECEDDHLIPSSLWSSLSKADDSRINDMRIWEPKPVNFEYFLNIKTNIIQFICDSKDDLKQLLDHIVNNPIVQLDKDIKVFAVKYNEYDWDYNEEITLFDVKTIEEYRNNHSTYNLLIDKLIVPYHEGLKQDWWCCEISLPSLRNSNEVHDTESPNDGNASQRNNYMSWLWLGLELALGLGLFLKHRSRR